MGNLEKRVPVCLNCSPERLLDRGVAVRPGQDLAGPDDRHIRAVVALRRLVHHPADNRALGEGGRRRQDAMLPLLQEADRGGDQRGGRPRHGQDHRQDQRHRHPPTGAVTPTN